MKQEIVAATLCKAIGLGCLIATMGVLARTFTGTDFGVYMLYLGTVQLAAVVTQLGLHQVIMRKLAERLERQEKTAAFICKSFNKVLIISSVIVGVSILIIWQTGLAGEDKNNSDYLMLGAGWAILATLQLAIADSFKAFKLPALSFIYGETGGALMVFALVVITVISGKVMTLHSIFIISALSTAVFVALGVSHLIVRAKRHDMHASEAEEQAVHYSSGWRICLAYSLILGVYPAILWFAGYYGGAEVAGQFALSHKLATLIVLPMLVTNSLMPRRVIGYKLNGTGKREIQKISAFATVTAIVGLVIFALAGEIIVGIWLGTDRPDITNMALWLQTGKLITVIFGASNIILIGYNQEHRFVEAGLITMFILVLILYLPYEMSIEYRIMAASVCSAIVHASYQFMHSRRVIGFFYPFPGLQGVK